MELSSDIHIYPDIYVVLSRWCNARHELTISFRQCRSVDRKAVMDRLAGENIYIGRYAINFVRCPGHPCILWANVMINCRSYFPLRDPAALEAAGITHILSLLSPVERRLIPDSIPGTFTHLLILCRDTPGANLLQYLPQTTRFIDSAVRSGGTVLVHCGLGVSRSATALLAYILYRDRISRPQRPQVAVGALGVTDGLTVSAVLGILRARRPVCDPIPDFLQQLEVYRTMGCPIDEQKMDADPVYQEWLDSRLLLVTEQHHSPGGSVG
jgi:hypothetical protein